MRYCDLIMKGGVTSGVVYPSAVLALREIYHFKNIGGTSAGAIAAAATAAAALGERRMSPLSDDRSGFTGLEQVAANLRKHGVIHSQFQPVAGGAAAFRLLVLLTGKASALRKAVGIVTAILTLAPAVTLAVFALLLGAGYLFATIAGAVFHGGAGSGLAGVVAMTLPAIFIAILVGALYSLMRVAQLVSANFLGLCSGMPTGEGAGTVQPVAFTEWLNETLQVLSGKASTDAPLRFEELWAATRYHDEPETEKTINLQLITTAVSHREPRTLPFANAPFWFRPKDFDRLFPATVVAWLVDNAEAIVDVAGETYVRLPAGGALPVVVATRMSLSFPFLFSAIPLYEPVWGRSAGHPLSERADGDGASRESDLPGSFRICWFSDGGIANNLPLHLFDAPLPNWPTFAIDLVYPDADADAGTPVDDPEASVFLPTSNNQGWQRTYRSIGGTNPVTELGSFAAAVIGAAHGWREQLQARAPGQRDRIVRIALSRNEGGFNLDMPESVLEGIGRKGTAAGNRLHEFKFENHYWIR